MIQIISGTIPNLGKYKTSNRIESEEKFDYASIENHREQIRTMMEIRTVIEEFLSLPCTVEIEVEARNGIYFLEGTIRVHDPLQIELAKTMLKNIDTLTKFFVLHFQSSYFKIIASQQMTARTERPTTAAV